MKAVAKMLAVKKENAERYIASHAIDFAENPYFSMQKIKSAIRSAQELPIIIEMQERLEADGALALRKYAQRRLTLLASNVAPNSSCPIDNLLKVYAVEFYANFLDDLEYVDLEDPTQ